MHTRNDVGMVLVFDFGGGTLDVSLLGLQRGTFMVRATAGDKYLGGEDITQRLVEHIASAFVPLLINVFLFFLFIYLFHPRVFFWNLISIFNSFQQHHDTKDKLSAADVQRVRAAAEVAKHALSHADTFTVSLQASKSLHPFQLKVR